MTIIKSMRSPIIILLLFSLVSVANAQEDSPHKRYLLGLFAYRAGKYEEAIKHWQQVVTAKPDEPKIAYCLGVAHFKSGLIGEAEKIWLTLLEEHPEFENGRLALAQIGQFMEEMGVAGKNHRDFARACAFRAEGEYFDAIEILKRLEKDGFNQEAVHYQLAICMLEDADEPEGAREALAQFEKLPVERREESKMIRRLAAAYGLALQRDKTIECLEKLVARKEGDGEIHYWLGRLYDEKRNFKKTMEHFQIATRMDSELNRQLIMDLPTFNAGRLLNALVSKAIAISEKSKNKEDDFARLLKNASLHIGIKPEEFVRILEKHMRSSALAE